jgi:hypothetical protein
MNLYAILRRSGWKSPGDLQEAAQRSTEEGERMSEDIRWIRSHPDRGHGHRQAGPNPTT